MTSTQRTIINNNIMKYLPLILLFLFACSTGRKEHRINESKGVLYNYEILYKYQGVENKISDIHRYKLSSDTLYFILESFFNNDTVTILSRDLNIFDGQITTEPSTGLAESINVGDIKNLKEISLKINSGPQITFELVNKEHNIIGISKDKDKIEIVFYKEVPAFY